MQKDKRWVFLAILYAISGITGVAYEILWARMLGLEFGASIFGVVFTVTAFMAGLGIGSIALERFGNGITRPVRVFAILETAVAIYSLVLPFISQLLDHRLADIATAVGYGQWIAIEGAISIALLMVPAAAMGASFPVMLRAFRNTPMTTGAIYGVNTTSAAIGALLPLVLLPALGWIDALRSVASIGIFVGAASWILSGNSAINEEAEVSSADWKIVIPYAGIGASSLMLQIGWTRIYGLVMLRTEYVLGIILATYLIGMGLGSVLAKRASRQTWLDFLPAMTGIFAVFSLWLLPKYSSWIESAAFATMTEALWKEGAILAAMTLPVTLCLGAWLPLISSKGENQGAWLYGINSLGGAVGALAAGFLIIPTIGTAGTIVMAAAGLLLFGLYFAADRRAWMAVPVFALAAFPVSHFPSVSSLLPKTQSGSVDLYKHEDAISITHVVKDTSGQRLLLTDMQRMDASTEPTAVFVQKNQARLPLLLHPAPHSILFLGLGTGISASGSAPYGGIERTAIELSQGAIETASTQFSPANGDIAKSMTIKRDDARHFLGSTQKKWDVIVGDLFHPDLAGVGALLSVEEFARARSHLMDGGIFVQWIALNQFDPQSLEVVLNSFVTAFPESCLFQDGMHLALVGKNGGKIDITGALNHLTTMDTATLRLATGGEGIWTWMGRYMGPIVKTAGPLQREWFPRIEFSLPRARYDASLVSVIKRMLSTRPRVTDAEKQLMVDKEHQSGFERAYIANELIMRSWIAALSGDEGQAVRMNRFAYQANPGDRWISQALADNMMQSLPAVLKQGIDRKTALQKILSVFPEQAEALRELLKMETDSGNAREAENLKSRLDALYPYDHVMD